MSIRSVGSGAQLTFVSLASRKELFPSVEKVFREIFSQGSHEDILTDIRDRKTRKTEILLDDDRAVGCIVFKRDLSLIEDIKASQCFSCTFFALFDPDKDSIKGYRTALLERAEYQAKEENARCIAFCLPNNRNSCIDYLEHKGYKKKVIQQDEVICYQDIQKRRKVDDEEIAVPPPPPPPPAVQKSSKPTNNTRTPIVLGEGSYQLTLKKPFINPILRGEKTIEGRINSGAPAKFKSGDTIRFFYPQNDKDDVVCEIEKVEIFNGFKEMLEATGYKKCIPNARSIDEAFRVYQDIPGFIDRARQSGVVAIYLKNPKRKG